MTPPRETFQFNLPVEVQEDWMIGLTGPEIYNSVFNVTEENNKFELYELLDGKRGGLSYEKVRDEIERDVDNSDFTATDIQDEIIAPIIINEYREQVTERLKNAGFKKIFAVYVSSVFQDFESHIRTGNDWVEDDMKLVLDE